MGFSMMGKRALDDPRNALVYHFVRPVVDLKAWYFVFENVRVGDDRRAPEIPRRDHRRFLQERLQHP